MNRFLIVIAFFLASCAGSTSNNYNADTTLKDSLAADGTITDTTSVPETEASTKLQTFKGFYIKGDEMNTFRSCDDPHVVYWLEDESKTLSAAYDKTRDFLSYPYESIYVELKGFLKGKSKLGYAAEYDNVLVVREVRSASQKSFKTPCFEYEYIALGNEPFWSLEIIPSEKLIAFKDIASEKTYVFPFRSGTDKAGAIVYHASNGTDESLEATIRKQDCSDGMSDRTYNYSAEVTINGKKFTGCAIKKGDKLSSNQ
jgi:uncharacterized membrane protein